MSPRITGYRCFFRHSRQQRGDVTAGLKTFLSADQSFEFVQAGLADEDDRLKDRNLADSRYCHGCM